MNINWNNYWISVAYLTSQRSKDPISKHGAVIVDKNNHVISIGYNGMINNTDNNIDNDTFFPWHNNINEYNKYDVVIHAEMNAILNCQNISLLKNSSLYLYSSKNYFCCNDCLKHICQVGIKNIIIPKFDKNNKYYTIATDKLIEYSEINVKEIGFDWKNIFNIKEEIDVNKND